MDSRLTTLGEDLLRLVHHYAPHWWKLTNQGQHRVYRGISLNAKNAPQLHRHESEFSRESKELIEAHVYNGGWPIVFLPSVDDRRPRDTRYTRHNAFQTVMRKAGAKADRENSRFAVGSRGIAEQYGSAMVMIPLGNFSYTWSPSFADWTRDFWWKIIRDIMIDGFATDARLTAYVKERAKQIEQNSSLVVTPQIWQDTVRVIAADWNEEPQDQEMRQHALERGLTPQWLKQHIMVDRGIDQLFAQHPKTELMIRADEYLLLSPVFYGAMLDVQAQKQGPWK